MTTDIVRWMRFARRSDDSTGFGTVSPSGEIEVHAGDMLGVSVPTGEAIGLDAVVALPPCTPTKIVGLWNNLASAASKNGWARPAEPLYFFKPSTACIGHGAAVVPPTSYDGRVVYEGELGVVIGRACANVAVEDVDDVVFGYTCVNDVTALELITADESFPQWCRGYVLERLEEICSVVD